MVHRNSGETLRVHKTESVQMNASSTKMGGTDHQKFSTDIRADHQKFSTDIRTVIYQFSGARNISAPEYSLGDRARESSINHERVGRFGRTLAEISPTIQAYNASYSVWPTKTKIPVGSSNKEACAGPTQTFFRPDTRAQEMWVKWEMNFDQPRFAVAPPTPSPVN